MNKYLKPFLLGFFLFSFVSSAQIKVTSLPKNPNSIFDPIFFDKNEVRNVELINSEWEVFQESDPQQKIKISVPAVFEGNESLIFEKKISFANLQIQNSQIVLGFLGLNYSAEISINGYSIYRHPGGSIPFELALPKDILKDNSKITIKVNNKLDSDYSIPSAQRFLFPNLKGGIIRDVYLKTVSPLHITYNSFDYSFNQQLTKAFINFKIGIGNSEFKKNLQSSGSTEVTLRISLFPNDLLNVQSKGDFVQTISSEDNEANVQLEVPNPLLWSQQTPNFYLCEVSLIRDGQIIDKTVKRISLYQLRKDENKFLLNGKSFVLQGTTYFLDETSLRKTNIYEKIKDDLTIIRNTGFNSVRFAKSYPHPYAVTLCQELGLLALVELPINSIPEEILANNEFQLRAKHAAERLVSNYSEYASAIFFGAGSSFLPNSQISQAFISKLNHAIKEKGFFTYASFVGANASQISNLDFYGIELYSSTIDETKSQFQSAIELLGNNSIFISEVTYPNYQGDLGGYLTKNSSDAQAKYFREIIELSRQLKISGFFINTLFDYGGAYASLYGGYSENNIYKFGVLDLSRNLNAISYKVLFAKLNDSGKVTIPIGVRKEESQIIFILLALFLSIAMAILINTKKKFKEDCTRALLRPYNFFADVRDHRIIPGIHTAVLMLIQAGSASLLITILLFYFRSNILFEKIILAFNEDVLMKLISYLAWNPLICFVILFAVMLFKFVLLALVIKLASLFVKIRAGFPSIFYLVVWTFLPLTLLLPLELILFKVLDAGNFDTIVLVFLVFFFFWMLQRLLKGVYVIFDVRPFIVYLYSLAVIILAAGGIILKYQLTSSTLYYISNAIKQYHSMIF